MKRQIRNAITSLVITAFAGIGLVAFAQNPCCPQPVTTVQTVQQQVVVEETTVEQPTCCPGPTCECTKELVKSIESNADRLERHFKRSLRRNCIEGCDADAYKEAVSNFEDATDRLKKQFRHCCELTPEQVQEVLDLANCISQYMDPCMLDEKAAEAWTCLQGDLQTLASQYCTTACFQQPVSLRPACPVQTCCPVQ